VEAANFDPKLRLYADLHRGFGQRQESGLWTNEILQALAEIEDGPWSSLTVSTLDDMLWPDGIERRNVWKKYAESSRKSNKGLRREQFESVWRELGFEAQRAQSSKIIRLPRHKSGTGEAQ